MTSIFIGDDEPQVIIWLAPSWKAFEVDPSVRQFVRFDARTGRIIERSNTSSAQRKSFLPLIRRLHTDLFAGLSGELFLGAMALLFVTAIVSGVALYGPFTRNMGFGEVRTERSRRVRWLDLHNLLGVVTISWALVVGTTGALNELSTPLFAIWRQTDVREMLAPWQGKAPPSASELSSLQHAVDAATRALPGMVVTNVLYPGDMGSTPHHYLVWAHGKTPLTARLFSPVLIDARTGKLTAVVKMPWYLRAIEVSRPLHFGDYGGMPLKIIWALLDLLTIVVLGSGLYLWICKRKRPPAAMDREDQAAPTPPELLKAAE